MSKDDSGFVYVGTAACGCRGAVAVDMADARTAKWVGEFIQDGLTVHRESLKTFRLLGLGCTHKPKWKTP